MVSTNFKDWVGKKTSLQEIKTQANQCECRAQRAASLHVGNLAGEASRSVCWLGRHSVEAQQPRKGYGAAAGALPGDFQLQTLLQTCCINSGSSFNTVMLQLVLCNVCICYLV